MNTIEITQFADLTMEVGRLIKAKIGTSAAVHTVAGQIIISISRFEVEHCLGNLLRQIYRAVDQHFPVRKDHLSLIIRDQGGSYETSFKIWKSGS